MYRFMQRNKKRLLAIFAAFLMIVFILPTTMNQGGAPGDIVLGKIGDDELLASEFQAAEQDWRTLNQLPGGPQTQFGQATPLAYRLGWAGQRSEFELMQGRAPFPVREITANPRLFLLLQREAQRMGVSVSADRVNDFLTNALPGPLPGNKQDQARIRRAIEALLLVEGGLERAASVIKVSQPALKHELARRSQNITVNAVEFPAVAYAEKMPAPTTQQVQEQFEKFAAIAPQREPQAGQGGPTTNPFGFGYRFPNRVKLQYLSIPHEDVKKAIEASKSDYEWEVEARKYYIENQSQFPTTQKSEADEAQFSLAGPTTAATRATTTTTKPLSTTRPFDEVKTDAKGRIVVPEVERKMKEIESRIAAIMAADYVAYRNVAPGSTAAGATRPATAPNSSQGVPFDSYEYLQRLAQTIQRDYKVLPTVAAFDDKLRDQAELAELANIGKAVGEETPGFADYATTAAEPFVPAEHKDDSSVLSLFEPSRPLRDNANNVYLFRLTAADPAHAPATEAEVADAVRKDVAAVAAFEQAKADATKLLDAAKQSGLKQAAQGAQKNVITVGPFPADVRGALPGLQLKDEANAAFAQGAFKLLTMPPPREGGKPVALIELPREGKVYVAELVDVAARPQMAMMGSPEAEIERGLLQELQQYFQIEWFNFDNAKKRLHYASAEPEQRNEPPIPAAPPRPQPLF